MGRGVTVVMFECRLALLWHQWDLADGPKLDLRWRLMLQIRETSCIGLFALISGHHTLKLKVILDRKFYSKE
jgi:hypothetical protein